MASPTFADPVTTSGAPAPGSGTGASGWAWAALLVAVAGLGGSLFLSMGMNLKACPLCFYQRTFVMALVGVLAMGLLVGPDRPRRLSLLALPLAVGGLGVALFHVSLEVRGKLECPAGLLGLGTAPQQSLTIFVVLTGLLIVDLLHGSSTGSVPWVRLTAAVVLGALLAWSSTIANPPSKPLPPEEYAKPPEVCRPPLKGQ